MQVLDTSYHCSFNLRVAAGRGGLYLDRFPDGKDFDELWVCLGDENGNCYPADAHAFRGRGEALSFPDAPDGRYSLQVFTPLNGDTWAGYIYGNDVILDKRGADLGFVKPATYHGNKTLLHGLPVSQSFLGECLRPSFRCQCCLLPVRKLAASLTKGLRDPFDCALAVYDWVTENIAYDTDSLRDNSYLWKDQDQKTLLSTGAGVCCGVSDLFVSLLRAARIPALSRSCYALGVSTDGGWERVLNMSEAANHDFPVFFAGGRWVLTDVTWDLRYEIDGAEAYGAAPQVF
jgi:hypothetical protein